MKRFKIKSNRTVGNGYATVQDGGSKAGSHPFNVEAEVKDRYAKGAAAIEASLCCPISYNGEHLKVIPKEILEKDYGCGDPSKYVREGDVVLDLGSGGGKICYIASQIVGPKGKVIGVDFNLAMLNLARKHQKQVSQRIGWNNVVFRRGRIQDLKTDRDWVEKKLSNKPISTLSELMEFEAIVQRQQVEAPLVAGDSVDVIVSNCVLNLVHPKEKHEMFEEMHRVLKKGGRIAISDIVSDEKVPESLQHDPELWTGCISGAYQEKALIKAFEDVGFYGIRIEKRDEKPWRTVQGIEFRSVTVTAYKGKEGACWEHNQAVLYKGPWKQVEDDDRHVLKRGVPSAVCDKTFQILAKEPYRDHVILIPPRKEIARAKAKPFDCARTPERDPRETKGHRYRQTEKTSSSCVDGGCC
jgi:arsenite methyltransferase